MLGFTENDLLASITKYFFYCCRHSNLVYPTYPDVKLKNLPFYKVDSVLMKPSSLQPRGHVRFQEQTFSFHLTPTQASAIAQSGCRDPYGRQEYKKQIQLRFSLLGKSKIIFNQSCDRIENEICDPGSYYD